MTPAQGQDPPDGFITPEGDFIELSDVDALSNAVAALALSPEETKRVLWGLAKQCQGKGLSRALRAYGEAALAFESEESARAEGFLTLGVFLEREKDLAAAAEVYRRGLSLTHRAPEVLYFLHNNLGFSLNGLARFREAEPLCRAAIDLLPARHNAHKNLGVALEGQGRLEEAAASLLRAIQLYPADPRAGRLLTNLLRKAALEGVDLSSFEVELAETESLQTGPPN